MLVSAHQLIHNRLIQHLCHVVLPKPRTTVEVEIRCEASSHILWCKALKHWWHSLELTPNDHAAHHPTPCCYKESNFWAGGFEGLQQRQKFAEPQNQSSILSYQWPRFSTSLVSGTLLFIAHAHYKSLWQWVHHLLLAADHESPGHIWTKEACPTECASYSMYIDLRVLQPLMAE